MIGLSGYIMNQPSFLTVCLNPTLQKTLVFPNLVPDTVNRTGEYRLDAAGKGLNAGRVLVQLGKNCIHLTQLGGMLRPLFLDLCIREGLKIEWVESHSPIRFCYTLLDRGSRQVTELVEEGERVGRGTGERLLEALARLLPDHSVLIISGSKAAGFSDNLIPEMVRMAKEAGLRVILDIRGPDLLNSLRWKPDVVKPNLLEFLSTFAPGLSGSDEPSGGVERTREMVNRICGDVYRKYGCRIVLTRGASSVWYTETGELADYAVDPAEPLNTTGSGDAFTAGLAAALEDGASLREAVAEGCRCGKLNAGLLRPGVIR
jgi:1-phosphofructokinase/tagatose 6-phosphate kinase